MTNEERDLISRFIERVAGVPSAPPPGGQPQLPAQPLPPVDHEADALIADLFNRYPDVRYRMTQTAFVQEHALVEAQNRISRLQWELQAARQAQAAPPQQAPASPWGAAAAPQPQQAPPQRGFFSNLFGGGAQPAGAPQPQYAPPQPAPYPQGYNPAMLQQQGPGFFGSALRTAAGVAGGVVAADALMGLFSGGHQGGGWGGGGGGGQGGFMPAGFENPWGGQAVPPGPDPYDVGGAAKEPVESDKFAGPADVDQSAWTPAPDQGGGWQDAASQDSGGGGWQDTSDQGGGFSDDDIQNS